MTIPCGYTVGVDTSVKWKFSCEIIPLNKRCGGDNLTKLRDIDLNQ